MILEVVAIELIPKSAHLEDKEVKLADKKNIGQVCVDVSVVSARQ